MSYHGLSYLLKLNLDNVVNPNYIKYGPSRHNKKQECLPALCPTTPDSVIKILKTVWSNIGHFGLICFEICYKYIEMY